VLKPSAIVELVWQDGSGSTAATTLNASSSATVTEIDADATALASILASLTDCVLVGQRIKYISVEETPVSASGSTPITRTGAFFFRTDFDNPIADIFVKAIKDDAIETSGVRAGVGIDITNSDVIAFIDAVIDNGVCNIFGDDIHEFIDAYLQSRL
jgi:hypothetical protein